METMADRLTIETLHGQVSGLITRSGPGPVLVLGHGAGAGMDHPFLAGAAEGLAEEGVSSLRFNFLYMERGRRAPDREPLLREAWTAAFGRAGEVGDPVWAGGKSLGGRIASMTVADGMPAAGLVFFGYPLHPPGKPERIRDAHLQQIGVPMLFIQGTRDSFARSELLEATLTRLGDLATLHPVESGDHSFRVRGQKGGDRETGRALGAVAAQFILAPA